jgi:hypothetical protein
LVLALAGAVLPAAFLSGCAAGIVAAVAGSLAAAGGGASSSSPTVLSDIEVFDAKKSPALIRFRLTDNERDPADVEITFRVGASAPQPVCLIPLPASTPAEGDPGALCLTGPRPIPSNSAIDARLDDLPTSSQGVAYTKAWDFEPQLGPGLTRDVTLLVSLSRPSTDTDPVPQMVCVGNDAPLVAVPQQTLPPDVSGVVPVPLLASDSSADSVCIRVEFLVEGDTSGWRPARPAQSDQTPPFAFEAERTSTAGRELTFFWDTDVDLGAREVDVQLRFLPTDGFDAGSPTEAPRFRVDNNREPIAFLDVASFLLSSDQRRGVPVPFRVQDPETNLVDIILQWRRSTDAGFPSLAGLEPDEIRALAADPTERRRLQIATECPLALEGQISLAGLDALRTATQVRLLGLGGARPLLRRGGQGDRTDLAGQELLILRPSRIPTPIGVPAGVLDGPVGAVPLEDGVHALVLDRSPGGGFRLRVFDLGRGAAIESAGAATGAGEPVALSLEPSPGAVVVAAASGALLRLCRVPLPSHPGAPLSPPRPLLAVGLLDPLRALACLGTHAAAGVTDRALLRFSYRDFPGSVHTIVDRLEGARDIAVDPVLPNRVYVAEGSGGGDGRVTILDIETRNALSQLALSRPEALAFASPARLLVVTDEGGDGVRELRTVEPASAAVEEIASGFEGEVAALATGVEDLTVVVMKGAADLLAGGGIRQRRRLESFDHGPEIATVPPDTPFDPPLRSGAPWKVLLRLGRFPALSDGTRGRFLWDSAADLPGGGEVSVRVLPFDDEQGLGQELDSVRQIRGELEVTPSLLGGGVNPKAPPEAPRFTDGAADVVAADIDGDGDLDLAAACRVTDNIEVFFQDAGGRFGRPAGDGASDPELPSVVLAVGSAGAEPTGIAAADLDGDGRLDLVSANSGNGSVSVFLQRPLSFADAPPSGPQATLRGPVRPVKVVAADLDLDGRVDLAVAGEESGSKDPQGCLAVFLQPESGFADGQWPVVTLQPDAGFQDPKGLAVADLNHDGLPDLVSANEDSHNLTLFFQRPGDAAAGISFASPVTLSDPSFRSLRSVLAADVDRDGSLDLVTASARPECLIVLRQDASGEFRAAARMPLPPDLQPTAVAAADLNADGLVDLLASSGLSCGGQGNVAVFYQEPRRPAPAGQDGAPPAEACADGQRADLVLSGLGSALAVSTAALEPSGRLAVVAADLCAGRIAVFRPLGHLELGALGPGGADEPMEPSLTLSDAGEVGRLIAPAAVTVADLNGDGILDIAAADRLQNLRAVYAQRNPARFEDLADQVLHANTGGGLGPAAIAAADLDGDGLVDLASADEFSDQITLFRQTSRGIFGAPVPGGPGDTGVRVLSATGGVLDSPQAIVLVDLDGDGRRDAASANRRSGNITVFLQPVQGFFWSEAVPRLLVLACPSLPVPGPTTVAAEDLDSDGWLDLVAASGAGQESSVTILFQPDGGFAPLGCPDRTTVLDGGAGTEQPGSVLAADLDGDGRVDVASANAGGHSIAVFLQPEGGFPVGSVSLRPVLIRDPQRLNMPVSLAAGDFNGDGRLDLASANSCTNNFTVFLQPFGGLVGGRPQDAVVLGGPSLTPSPFDVAAADLDGDGDLDLVGSGRGSIWVFWGNH